MANYKEKLLVGICEKLQLTPSKYKLADERYHIIAETIQADPVFKNIKLEMYPHGSFRLKTTVKPLSSNEYDLDFVVEIPRNVQMTPVELYNHIFRILSRDGVHNGMVEKKSRCIRVNYANDFHIDIMPGQIYNQTTHEIIVPDRELKSWYHHSNPIGYANWFEEQAKTQIINEMRQFMSLQERAEPIADQEMVKRLEPLRRAVQLIKRYRDIYCAKTKTEPVRSIVLCTLMGHISSSYSGDLDIINDFCLYIRGLAACAHGKPFEVKNPVVDEVLTEKWQENKKNYLDFIKMMISLEKDVKKLNDANNNTEIVTLLKKMFGERVTTTVIKEQAGDIFNARELGTLSVGPTGLLNTNNVGPLIKKNTFYGE